MSIQCSRNDNFLAVGKGFNTFIFLLDKIIIEDRLLALVEGILNLEVSIDDLLLFLNVPCYL